MIRVHLVKESEPVYTLEYKRNLKALETALRGRSGYKIVIVDGVRVKNCPKTLFNTLQAIVTNNRGNGVVIFLNDFDARKLIYK